MKFQLVKNQNLFWLTLTAILLTACQSSSDQRPTPFFAMRPHEIWEDTNVRSLAWAAARNQTRTIERLYNEGVDINNIGSYGATPLWWALQRRGKQGFKKLLELGANPNIAFQSGESIMSFVVQIDDPYYFEQTMIHEGNPFYFNESANSTLLHWAARDERASIEIVESLINMGVDLDVQDYVGATAIIRAVARDRYDIAYLLLTSGADPTLETTGGLTIFDWIELRRGFEVDAYTPGMPEWRVRFVSLLNEQGYNVD